MWRFMIFGLSVALLVLKNKRPLNFPDIFKFPDFPLIFELNIQNPSFFPEVDFCMSK